MNVIARATMIAAAIFAALHLFFAGIEVLAIAVTPSWVFCTLMGALSLVWAVLFATFLVAYFPHVPKGGGAISPIPTSHASRWTKWLAVGALIIGFGIHFLVLGAPKGLSLDDWSTVEPRVRAAFLISFSSFWCAVPIFATAIVNRPPSPATDLSGEADGRL